MLHEVLYALLGRTGWVVVEEDNVFDINPALSFLSTPERKMLQQIVALGSFYKKIRGWVEEEERGWVDRVVGKATESETVGRSAYVRTLAEGIGELLKEYEREVLSVEADYLSSKVFTFAEFGVRFGRYYTLFPEAILLLETIEEEGLRGGQLVDLLQRNSLHGHGEVRSLYGRLLGKLYKQIYEQIVVWLLHGRLHDSCEEFFIHKLTSTGDESNTLEDWNHSFDIRPSLLPKTLIPAVTAEKILFIGKYVRVVSRAREEIAGGTLFSREVLAKIKEMAEFDYSRFQEGIEFVRAEVGRKFLGLFLNEENMEEHLKRLKDFYLLGKGEFFQVLIEECQPLFKFPPTKYSENDLNNRVLPSVLMRLGCIDPKLVSLVKLTISTNGFEYKEFGQLNGLLAKGDVTQPGGVIRFGPTRRGPTSACIYHPSAQSLSTGFELVLNFRFRRTVGELESAEGLSAEYLRGRQCPPSAIAVNAVAVVIQNCVDVNNWKKKFPVSLSDLTEYVAVRVGFYEQGSSKGRVLEYCPFISVETCSESKGRRTLQEKILSLDEHNFAEVDTYKLKISYSRSGLSAGVWRGEASTSPAQIDVVLNLEDVLQLELGKGFVGVCADGWNAAFSTDLRSWALSAFNTFNADDPWNGLSVSYHCNFPVSLVLSPAILERYRNIFRLLFPLKQLQQHLNRGWLGLNQQARLLSRGHSHNKLSALRARMSFIIDSLLSYFYLDVLEVRWSKLKDNLRTLKEFEELRKCVNTYLESIYLHTFLTYPHVTKNLFAIVGVVKSYLYLMDRVEQGERPEDIDSEARDISETFDSMICEFIRQLENLNMVSSSQYLSQLLTRLNFNSYYENRLHGDMDTEHM